MFEGWFGGWFGGWFSEWFGGGSEVPIPPVVAGGGRPLDRKKAGKRRLTLLDIHELQQDQAGLVELQTVLELTFKTEQDPGWSAALVEYDREEIHLPPLQRKQAATFKASRTIDTIGEYIPRPHPPQLHPSPRSPTRTKRQQARKERKRVRTNAEEDAIAATIASLL